MVCIFDEFQAMSIKVSIIIPTKNCARTISTLLDSLQKQDYPDYEIVVVDSSNDGTDKIALRYNVRLLSIPPIGLNAARNAGIRASTGDIICFTDGDCEVPSGWVGKIVREFKSDPYVGCVGGSVLVKSETFWGRYSNETLVSIFPRYSGSNVITLSDFYSQPFNMRRLVVGCNMAFRRQVLEELGGFDENWKWAWDEFELMYRMLRQGYSIKINPEIVVYHYPRSSLKEMLSQAYWYGTGAGAFAKKFGTSMLRGRAKYAITGTALTWLHSLRILFKTWRPSALLYPLIDYLMGGSYYLGLIRTYLGMCRIAR